MSESAVSRPRVGSAPVASEQLRIAGLDQAPDPIPPLDPGAAQQLVHPGEIHGQAAEGLRALLETGLEAGRWVMFYDPAGNLIEMVEARH